MYVWRLWGDIWVVDRDPVTFIITNVLIFCFMIAITVAAIALWLPFMAVKWAWSEYGPRTSFPAFNSGETAVLGPDASSAFTAGEDTPMIAATAPEPCPHCGNTSSLDIRPCIRCGN